MKRFYFFILCALFSVYHVSAKKINLAKGATTDSVGYCIKLPYELIKNKLIVKIEIGNQEHRFLFDTGAPVSISETLLNDIKPTEKSDVKVVDANGKKGKLTGAILSELKMDKVRFTDIPVLVLPDSSIFLECWKIDGIIGSNILKNSIVRFEPKDSLIIITDDETKLPLKTENASELSFDKQKSPYFKIRLENKKEEKVLFDTGDGNLFSLKKWGVRSIKRKNIFKSIALGYGNSGIGIWGNSDSSIVYRIQFSEVKLNNTLIRNIVASSTSSLGSRIGSELLKYGVVTVDYKNKKFYFEPFDLITNAYIKDWNIDFVYLDGKLCVGALWGNFNGELNYNDEIIQVDDIPLEGMSRCDILMGSFLLNKEKAELTVRSKDQSIRKVFIEKK